MEPWSIVSLALGVALVAVSVVAVRRDRALRVARDRLRHRERSDDALDHRLTAIREDAAVLHDALPSGVLRVDPGLRIREASPRAHDLLDRAPGTLVGRTVMEAFLDPAIEGVVRNALARGAGAGELRPADVDGAAFLVRARRTSAGDGAWIVIDDVSELRRLQRIRAEFIDNLSHELRTPLTTVSLLAETLQRDAREAGEALPARMRDRIGKIEVETGHLVQMVSELLDLSRIESGGTLDLADDVDMAGLAATSAERLRSFAERHGVALTVDPADVVPAVRADAARLGQVVVNLVHNAVKFSPDGGEVRVAVRVDDGEVVTSVADRGIGIPAGARDRVFERFYKVDRARLRPEVGGGTGLGLAIARHVVDQHGGRIWVESTEGKGSTFSFAIPTGAGRRDAAR